jgi:hypothetical protein
MSETTAMIDTNSLDIFVGILALLIIIGGLVMLFNGISAFDRK